MIPTEVIAGAEIDHVVACLGSDRRRTFLAALAQALAIEARRAYPKSASAPESSGLICHNELLLLVGARLRADLSSGPGLADEALVDKLVETARGRGCLPGLGTAVAGVESRLRTADGLTAVQESGAPRVWMRSCLASARRPSFLAELIDWLSLTARGLYPQAGTRRSATVKKLICYNETFHTLAAQLRADVEGSGSDGGYPDRDLIEAMLWDARLGGCEDGVRAALSQALTAATA